MRAKECLHLRLMPTMYSSRTKFRFHVKIRKLSGSTTPLPFTAMIEDDAESKQGNDYVLINTPSHTTEIMPRSGHEGLISAIDSVPWPGRTYMIRNRASDGVLARENGSLVVKRGMDLTSCGWHWACVENEDGWLGFRETSSGVYLGRDDRGGFKASASEHRTPQLFDLRRHPGGGYQMLSIRWWTRLRMAVDVKSRNLVEISGSGEIVETALWDFVDI